MNNQKGNGEIAIILGLAGAMAIAWRAGLLLGMMSVTGCMQMTGAKKIDLWGAVFEANNGIELTAGIQQYDRVNNNKGIGATNGK